MEWLDSYKNLNTAASVIKDLSAFQTYILNTKDTQEEIKTKDFKIDWKDYFGSKAKVLVEKNVSYEYFNKVVEKNSKDWCYKTAWWGRGPKKYKVDPIDIRCL